MVEADILTILRDSSPTTSAGANVFAWLLPQDGAFPAVSYQRIANIPTNSLSGSSGNDRVRMQVDCWAVTYAAAKTLSSEVRSLMEGASFKALLETDSDDFDVEAKVYRVSMDFYCWQKET